MTTWLIFKLILVLQLPFHQIFSVEATENQLGPNVADITSVKESNCEDRIAKIEAKGNEQEKEITNLKTIVVEDGKTINYLIERMARLEQSVKTSEAGSDVATLTRSKRPYRLIPVQERKRIMEKEYGSKNNEEDNSMGKPFYGPAASCDELGQIGYTLNGYYLVKGQTDSKTAAIEAIYCYFKNTGEPNRRIKEERFGVVTLNAPTAKTKGNVKNQSTKNQASLVEHKVHATDENLQSNFTLGGSNVANTSKLLPLSNRVDNTTKTNTELSTIQVNKLIALNFTGGKSYPLRNENGKCLSGNIGSLTSNGIAMCQASCDPSKREQRWKWISDRLCNDFEKCLSFNFVEQGKFHDNPDTDNRQKWAAVSGQIVSNNDSCLGVVDNSKTHGSQLTLIPCHKKETGSLWSFYES